MRVAFTLIGGKAWTGGANYLHNLLSLCARYQPGRLTPVLFVSEDTAHEDYAKFEKIVGLEIVKTPVLNAPRQRASMLSALFLGRDADMTALFKTHGIDVVFESARFFGWRLGVPAVAWIPDMQHRKLPQFFSKASWIKREIGFRLQILGGRRIMVSSHDARVDCEEYYPATKGRIGVVRFAIPPIEAIDLKAANELAASYNLPHDFFFMPNQFWRHKNHLRVIEALTILRQRGKRPVIAASGMQLDPRDPTHVPKVVKAIEDNGLADQFRLLGMIPYAHLAQLMLASAAVINASLSEGWSTTVEEAKSLGKKLLVSSLKVHHEQLEDAGIFFDPLSPAAIADAIEQFTPPGDEAKLEAFRAASIAADQRALDCAKSFCDFLENACRGQLGSIERNEHA